MKATVAGIRRTLYGMFAAIAVGGAAVAALVVPSAATAAPDPCAASEIAKTVGTVATNTGTYLDTHPQSNQALTTISRQQAGPQSLGALKSYFDTNRRPARISRPSSSPSPACPASASCRSRSPSCSG